MYNWIFKKKIFLETSLFVVHFQIQFHLTGKRKEKVPDIWGKHVAENIFLIFEVIAHERVGTQSHAGI